jgi:very-short-patch-repair endonuclease
VSIAQAKELRGNMTDAERRLWYWLRARRFGGHKFKRQVPIGPYVVDFACLGRKLVVEVDGGQHNESESDRVRASYLDSEGFGVLRFWNNDVLSNTQGVLEVIVSALEQSPSPGSAFGRATFSPLRGARGKQASS